MALFEVFLLGFFGVSAVVAGCPFDRSTDTAACAWISSCSVPSGCDAKCVANIFDQDTLEDRVAVTLSSTMMCHVMSYFVDLASGMSSRRLQAEKSTAIPTALKTLISSIVKRHGVSSEWRRLQNSANTDSPCPSDGQIDAASEILKLAATEVESGDEQADERALMEEMVSLLEDTGKLKSWMRSSCKTEAVTGDEMAMYTTVFLDTMSDEMSSSSMTVCKSSDDSILQLQTQILQLTSSGGACDTSAATVAGASCIGSDAKLMLQDCLNLVSPILKLDSADVAMSASSWNTIHVACMAISDRTECQAKTMEQERQSGMTAMVNMDQDAQSANVELTKEIGSARTAAAGSLAAIMLTVVALTL